MDIKKIFYHGTSTNIKIDKFILPPIIKYNQREDFRRKYVDKVFITDSIKSAKMYAKKAAALTTKINKKRTGFFYKESCDFLFCYDRRGIGGTGTIHQTTIY